MGLKGTFHPCLKYSHLYSRAEKLQLKQTYLSSKRYFPDRSKNPHVLFEKQTERETERDVSEIQALEELAGMSPATPTGVNFRGAFEKLAVDFKGEENKSEEVRNGFGLGDFCPCM